MSLRVTSSESLRFQEPCAERKETKIEALGSMEPRAERKGGQATRLRLQKTTH